MPPVNFHSKCKREEPTRPCMCSPFSHLSIDVSTAHVDTISRVKFTFAQTLIIGGYAKWLEEALKMRTKSGLTLRLAHYSPEVQRLFMLTYVLFVVVI